MSASTAAGPIGSTAAEPPPVRRRHGFGRFLFVDSPYILMLLAAFGGISYRAFYGRPILGYWEILVVAFGALCIWAGLPRAKTTRQVYDLVWTQVLHWAGFFGVIMLLATSRSARNSTPTLFRSLSLPCCRWPRSSLVSTAARGAFASSGW